ncbi:AMP-binding protein [Blastococcus sp. SYSU DS1021]
MDIESYLEDLRARQESLRPPDTPSSVVYPLGEISLPEHVAHWAATAPDRVAVSFQGRDITYSELDDLNRRAAGWLQTAGVRPGDRVGVFLPNSPEFIVTFLAVLRLGAVHVPINPMFQPGELAYEVNDSGARILVTAAPLLDVVERTRDELPVERVIVVGDGGTTTLPVTGWPDVVAHERYDGCATDLDTVAALNYTGGTTGLPKGCIHTQRHMIYTAATGAGATGLKADDGFVGVCFLPIFWIAGEDLGILIPIVLGGTVVLMQRWDASAVLDSIDRYRATFMVGTVENYLELMDHPDLPRRDLTSLRHVQAVSFVRKLTPEVRERWSKEVGSGVLREAAYGMTETNTLDTSPYGFQDGDQDLRAEPVFCGLPVPGTDIAVVSFETGEPMPVGEVGEIVVRSPSVTTGYWNNPAATATQLVDGWLHTGDSGRIDHMGCLHYLGRRKEMIKVKGMSVFPAEVEVLLGRHPDVDTVAVVPAEDPERGQRPVAFVRTVPGSSLDAEALQEWARGQMSGYKVPLVRVVDTFPMTETGKIKKNLLAGEAQEIADRA